MTATSKETTPSLTGARAIGCGERPDQQKHGQVEQAFEQREPDEGGPGERRGRVVAAHGRKLEKLAQRKAREEGAQQRQTEQEEREHEQGEEAVAFHSSWPK